MYLYGKEQLESVSAFVTFAEQNKNSVSARVHEINDKKEILGRLVQKLKKDPKLFHNNNKIT